MTSALVVTLTAVAAAAHASTPASHPIVTGFSPRTGPADGGDIVTVTGQNLSGTSYVTFGSAISHNFHAYSDSKLTVRTPVHGPGRVYLVVHDASGAASAESTGLVYRYQAHRPVITAFSPRSGPSAGGGFITITGHHLAHATSVLFGTVQSPYFHAWSDTKITARVLEHTPGRVYLRVYNAPDGTSAASTRLLYTYE